MRNYSPSLKSIVAELIVNKIIRESKDETQIFNNYLLHINIVYD